MSRAARRVPANWEHPKDATGTLIPLKDSTHLEEGIRDWEQEAAKWGEGLQRDTTAPSGWVPIAPEDRHLSYSDAVDVRPDPRDYMPIWQESERTHWQMYEEVTEGTPISPIFATPEELARWLTDNDTNAFADTMASYAQWLSLIELFGHLWTRGHQGRVRRSVPRAKLRRGCLQPPIGRCPARGSPRRAPSEGVRTRSSDVGSRDPALAAGKLQRAPGPRVMSKLIELGRLANKEIIMETAARLNEP